MRKIILTLTCIFACCTTFAQTNLVKGRTVDSQSGQPEQAAIIQFIKDGNIVSYTTSGEDGTFSQELPINGEYTLLYESIGRKRIEVRFTADGREINLGDILIEDDVQALKAGQVVAQRTLVKMDVDKTTYDVEGDTDSKTSTVLDMLRKVPMVSVDGQDNITVNGSSSFLVYVDGKPNQMLQQNASTILKMMPASAVKSIEVTTNPGAKYDAEGVGGVLNLVTNKAATGQQNVADGYYGSITARLTTKGGGAGVYSSMQKGKFSMGLNLNVDTQRMKGTTIDLSRVQDSGFETSNHSETTNKNGGVFGDLTASYEIDSLNIVSATAGLMSFRSTSDGISSSSISFPGTSPMGYNSNIFTKNRMNDITAGLDYQHTWAEHKDRSLVLSYQFSGAPGGTYTHNTFDGSPIPGFDLSEKKMDNKENSISHTLQADFTTNLGEKQTLSSGLKYIGRHNSADVDDLASGLNYDFYNRIGAAYTEFSGTYGKFGVKAGARYEHTWQDYHTSTSSDFTTKYGNLVPSASIQWNMSQMQNLGISYNMRISRPGISYLNPYVNNTDPTAIEYGNPEIETERGHTLNLVYNFYSPALITNLTFRSNWCNNGVSQYSFFDTSNIMTTTYGNIVKSNENGLNGFVMIIPGKKTRIYINGGFSYTTFESEALNQSNNGWMHNIMIGVQQTLPWDLRASANIIERGRTLNLQGWNDGFAMGIASLTKSFLDDKLSFSLSAVSPFAKDGCLHMDTHTQGNGFISDMHISVPVRQLHFQMSWTFGQNRNYNAKKIQRGISNDSQLEIKSTDNSVGTTMTGVN